VDNTGLINLTVRAKHLGCPILVVFCATGWGFDFRKFALNVKVKIPILSRQKAAGQGLGTQLLKTDYAGAPNRTETNLETPGSCMVTP
jgi:hypothetical protein